MPRGDRTGPYGDGPGTGRGLGYCNGYNAPGYLNNTAGFGGRGFGRGFGRHFGWGYGRAAGYPGYGAAYGGASEKTYVENEIRLLQDQLKNLEKRLSELKKDNS